MWEVREGVGLLDIDTFTMPRPLWRRDLRALFAKLRDERACLAAGFATTTREREVARAAIDEPRVDVEADTLPTPAVYLHEHRNKQGRVVTSWFARR